MGPPVCKRSGIKITIIICVLRDCKFTMEVKSFEQLKSKNTFKTFESFLISTR